MDSQTAGSERSLEVNTAGVTGFGDGVGNDYVGGGVKLASLLTDAPGSTVFNILGSTTGTPSVSTTGTQTYNDAVVLALNTVLKSTGAGALGNIQFNSTVDSQTAGSERSLEVNTAGDEVFNGVVGGGVKLAGLTTDASGTVGGSAIFNMDAGTTAAGVNVTGAVLINDKVTFNIANSAPGQNAHFSVLSGGSQTYKGAATLSQSTLLKTTAADASGFVTFADAVSGAGKGLLVDTHTGTGAITFSGQVGGPGVELSSFELVSQSNINFTSAGIYAQTVGLTSTAGSVDTSLIHTNNLYFQAKNSASVGVTAITGGKVTVAGTAGTAATVTTTSNLVVGKVNTLRLPAPEFAPSMSGIKATSVTLTAGGSLSGGVVTATNLTVSAGTITLQTAAANLSASGGTITINQAGAINLVNVSGGVVSVNAVGLITASKVTGTGNVSLTSSSGGIVVGQVSAGATLNLVTTGSDGLITETGHFSANTLTVTASGNVNLANDGHKEINNTLQILGAVSRAGDFALTASAANNAGLIVNGAISDGSAGSQVKIVTYGGLTLNNTITVSGGGNHVGLNGVAEPDLLLVSNDSIQGGANAGTGIFVNNFGAKALILSNNAVGEIFAADQKDSKFNGLLANYFGFSQFYDQGNYPVFNHLQFGNSSGFSFGFIFYNGGLVSGDLLAQFSLNSDTLIPQESKKDTYVAVDDAMLLDLQALRRHRNPARLDAGFYGPFELTGYDYIELQRALKKLAEHPDQKEDLTKYSILDGLPLDGRAQ